MTQDDEAVQVDITAVASPAPGGTLAGFTEHLKAHGLPCDLTADGTQAWVPGARSELQRFPFECTEPVDDAVLREVLKQQGIRVVSYLVEGGAAAVPNCFDYVCRDSGYTIDNLPKNARRDIRRGLRGFAVRLCTWDELAERGSAAHADTMARHGYASPPPDYIQHLTERLRGSPFYEVWGAWQGDELAAWMTIIKIDDWAMIDLARSCTEALNLCPNNALLYTATRHLLVDQKYAYVTYGLSSIQVNVHELSMHKYKTRMGYEALRMHRVFVVQPALRPLVTSPLMSWGLEKLAGLCPKSANLRKIAGMSRLLSGRQKSGLAWADEAEGSDG